jgi:hypothetical protein
MLHVQHRSWDWRLRTSDVALVFCVVRSKAKKVLDQALLGAASSRREVIVVQPKVYKIPIKTIPADTNKHPSQE